MAEKNNILDIVRGISQAMANSYDGAVDENGERIKIGLKREEGDLVLDKRVMDGFGVSISGNTLIVKYQSEIMLRDVHGGKFESEVEQSLADIVSYLKKQYKKATGNSLTLTKSGDPDMLVQNISRVRSVVNATQKYTIGGIDAEPEMGKTVDERLDDTFKKFLGFDESVFPGAQKPKNVKGKRDEEPKN